MTLREQVEAAVRQHAPKVGGLTRAAERMGMVCKCRAEIWQMLGRNVTIDTVERLAAGVGCRAWISFERVEE